MIVAHVLSSLQIGGGERVALELAAGQAAAGHEVIVVSLAPAPDGPLARAFRPRGVAVHRVAKRPGFDPDFVVRLALALRRRGVDVVHLHNRLAADLRRGRPGRLAGAVVVHTRHGPGRGTRRRAAGCCGARADCSHAYVAVSPEIELLERERGRLRAREVSVIENGIDLGAFDSARRRGGTPRARRWGLPPDAWVVGSLGRFAAEKDYPLPRSGRCAAAGRRAPAGHRRRRRARCPR